MIHSLFPTTEALLAPALLSQLTKQTVTSVSLRPLTPEFGRSGSRILQVTTNDGSGPALVLKRVSLDWDWLMRSTEDSRCRSVTLWQSGLFDQLPPEVATGVLACARDGAGWAILMQDVGARLLPFTPFADADSAFYARAMAAVHAQFWQLEQLKQPDMGLCQLHHLYQMFAPRTAAAEINGDNEIPRRVVEGWALARALLPADVGDLLDALLADPGPLCRALARFPFTLVHGDWRHANQAYTSGAPPLYLLDWQLAAAAPPAVELGRYLITNSPLLPVPKETVLAQYREQLAARLGARFDAAWWEPQLALGLLGGFLQDAWAVALKATHWHVGAAHRAQWQADLAWWSTWVRAGARWL